MTTLSPTQTALHITYAAAAKKTHVQIQPGLLKQPQSLAAQLQAADALKQSVLIVTDKIVGPLYLKPLQAALKQTSCAVVHLDAGEAAKTWSNGLETIFSALVAHQHHRNTTLIALGGGVICDLVGFAAACYQRGVRSIAIPTTLLAQVDAALGGKTAINYGAYKNLLGAFYPPCAILIDPELLSSLSVRLYRCGLAEMIKIGLVLDVAYVDWLTTHSQALLARTPDILEQAIRRACQLKIQTVEKDPLDQDCRRLLNFGHTFGHAIERLCQDIQHGEAVAIGMMIAARISHHIGMLSKADLQAIGELLTALRLPITPPPELDWSRCLTHMRMDKKISSAHPTLILLRSLGEGRIVETLSWAALQAMLANVTSENVHE